MERLSAKLDGKGVIMLPSGVEHDWCIGTRKVGDVTIQYLSGAAADRLDAYEDTGLTPEAVIDLQERFRALYNEFNDLDLVDPVHFYAFLERVCRWQQAEQSGRLVELPCKIGDAVWTIKNFKGHERARIGYVSEMFYTKYMKLFIVVKNTGRGFWGEGVFPSEAEAVAALERREEPT